MVLWRGEGSTCQLLLRAIPSVHALSRRSRLRPRASAQQTVCVSNQQTACGCASLPTEREIKYKQEKKYWEEQQKELAARVAALSAERDALRGGSGAQQLEERIQVARCCSLCSLSSEQWIVRLLGAGAVAGGVHPGGQHVQLLACKQHLIAA